MREIIAGFENEMREPGKQFMKITGEEQLTSADFKQKSRGIAGYFFKVLRKMDPDKYEFNSFVNEAIESVDGWVSKTHPRADHIKQVVADKLMPLAQQLKLTMESSYSRYLSAVSVMEHAYMSGLLGKLAEKLNKFRGENNLLLISDNNLFLQKAIGPADAPFIYEKSGNRYSHFMLDEFQDTSDYQWQNLLPLIQNALGSGHYTLLVGDAKQSIYRWRGGNMQLLEHQVQHDLRFFSENMDVQHLASNYRSRQMIVDFNNRFFSIAPGYYTKIIELDHPYNGDDHKQKWVKGEPGEGYVKFTFLPDSKASVDEESGEETEATQWKQTAGDITFDTIQQLLKNGCSLSDIALLTRSNFEARMITTHLLEKGIEHILSPESLLLSQSPGIIFLINLLRYINDPNDNLALSQIVHHYRKHLLQDDSVTGHHIFSSSVYTKLSMLPDAFVKRGAEFKKIPLFDTVEELISMFALADKPNAYIQRFADVIMEYQDRNPATIADFLVWWDENNQKDSCTVIIPSNTDAIRVMTIHKSKGLQFPVVIIPYADWKMTTDFKSTIWVNCDEPPFNSRAAHPVRVTKRLEKTWFASSYHDEIRRGYIDNLNMLYVAFTRAEQQLHVFSKHPSSIEGDKISNDLHPQLFWSLSQMNELGHEVHDDGSITFISGNDVYTADAKKNTGIATGTLDHWISNQWTGRLKMVVNKQKISSSDPDLPDLTYGLHFHNLASTLVNSADVESVLLKYSETHNPGNEIVIKLKEDLHTFIRFANEYNWLDSSYETLNETEVLLPDGNILRPDRLLIKEGEAIVIDYKTGAEEPHHTKQIQQYTVALQAMGYHVKEMFLVYPRLGKVVPVKAA